MQSCMIKQQTIKALALSLAIVLLPHCSSDEDGGSPSSPSLEDAVIIDPADAAIAIGEQLQLQARHAGAAVEVHWKVAQGPGSIDDSGVYSAPASLTVRSVTATIRATMQRDESIRGFAQIVVSTNEPDPNDDPGTTVSLAVQPESAALNLNEELQCQAFFNGQPASGVSWAVTEGPGTVDANGLYRAPSSIDASKLRALIEVRSAGSPPLTRSVEVQVYNYMPGTVCFQRDVMPMLLSNCAMSGCHDAKTHADGIDLSSYEAMMRSHETVRPYNAGDSELYESITDFGDDDLMPPPPRDPLSKEQIALVRRWINEGAPDSDCAPPDGSNCDTVDVGFRSTIQPLMQSYCVGCHSNAAPADNLALESYEQVRNSARDGGLLGSIVHDPAYKAMPSKDLKLNDCQIKQIRVWIAAGTPDN